MVETAMVEAGTVVRTMVLTMVHRGGRGTMETRSMSGAAAGAGARHGDADAGADKRRR